MLQLVIIVECLLCYVNENWWCMGFTGLCQQSWCRELVPSFSELRLGLNYAINAFPAELLMTPRRRLQFRFFLKHKSCYVDVRNRFASMLANSELVWCIEGSAVQEVFLVWSVLGLILQALSCRIRLAMQHIIGVEFCCC